jgi:hypothetical protein
MSVIAAGFSVQKNQVNLAKTVALIGRTLKGLLNGDVTGYPPVGFGIVSQHSGPLRLRFSDTIGNMTIR